MPTDAAPKILARNVAAVRRFADPARVADSVTGNPASTRLESGVGNCYPGLECDLRNLERRFLPFLEVDILGDEIRLVGVDRDGVGEARNGGALSSEEAKAYADLAAALAAGHTVVVTNLTGTFGTLGTLTVDPRTPPKDGISTGKGRLPSDAWTAVRLLTEGTDVEVRFEISVVGISVTVKAKRARYLDDNGALSAAFLPGELTQSLCSPWTHDFRDCGCFYWATNHPDIVHPVYPAAGPPADRQPWQAAVPWQRRDRRNLSDPPPAATGDAAPIELRHYEINQRWEELHFVVGRREITAPFVSRTVQGVRFPNLAALLAQLHYAVGVELAVAQEYLSAAYSLKADDDPSLSGTPSLRDDVRATRAELMRIAIGEMRHTRVVNDVIRGLMPAGTYAPALRVARALPHAGPGPYRPVQPRAATRQAITDFIEIEAPSAGVDGLYVDILETLTDPPADVRPVAVREWSEAIGSVIAEGEDHYQTFLDIQEWLSAHPEAAYLRAPNPPRPTPGQPEHDALQAAYGGVLELLHAGYANGRFQGATEINAARSAMVDPAGLDTLAHAVAQKGFLVAFDDIADPRFMPIDPPPAPPVA